MAFLKLTEQNVQGKTVLIRADMNVPFKDGNISDDTRIRASLASIKYCLDNGASVIVMTHLAVRPKANSILKTMWHLLPRIWANCWAKT